MKLFSLAVFALALFSLAPAADAQTVTRWTMTVDAVAVGPGSIGVRGVVEGEAAPSTHSVTYTLGTEAERSSAREACHRSLLLALARPGQYVATVGRDVCAVALIAP